MEQSRRRSDEHAGVLLSLFARYAPEESSADGIVAADERVTDFGAELGVVGAGFEAAAAEFDARAGDERDPQVVTDLRLMRDAAERRAKGLRLSETYEVPYADLAGTIFAGIHNLLEDRVDAARRPAALVRLRAYAGLDGRTPATDAAAAYTREGLERKALMPPQRARVERDLSLLPALRDGVRDLLAASGLAGWEEPFARLSSQLDDYAGFLRDTVFPRARDDFRLAPAVYAHALRSHGVDVAPDALAAEARAVFRDEAAEFAALAGAVARERGWDAPRPAAVLARLRDEQLVGAAILEVYRARLAEIEAIIARERIVTLPARPARIRLASEAESARIPAPHMRPPRLIGNTGESGEFVLPLALPDAAGSGARFTDFTYDAVAWPITAHETRPGHELQFAAMVEDGVSIARALFAMNTVNIEGWGLYAEWLIEPYMPLEGRLATLQTRLWRTARAFLDPELQAGTISLDAARAVLVDEVGMTDAVATAELQRYTMLIPGQAASYFFGYRRMRALRAELEDVLGPRFDALHFHDYVVAQGLVPPALLRESALRDLSA